MSTFYDVSTVNNNNNNGRGADTARRPVWKIFGNIVYPANLVYVKINSQINTDDTEARLT